MGSLFYRNSRLTVLVIGLILVAGAAAFQSLARQEDPTLSRRFGTVTTFFPGASALRVESLVTEKLEGRLQELHEIEELDSTSRTGLSVIQIQLADEYDEDTVDQVWSKVRDKLADARGELPAGVSDPEFADRTSTAVTLLVSLAWEGEGAAPLGVLTRLAEELENRLRNLPGTRETELHGEAAEEVRVSVDPLALAAANLTVRNVSNAIARADAKMPAGQLRNASNDLLIEVGGELDSLARIREVPLRREPDGRFLRVGDISSVEKTVREPPTSLALPGGRRGVVVSATMETPRRVDLWAERARKVVEEFRAEVPDGVAYEVIFDQSMYTEERLTSLVGNLLLGSALVVGVLFFMMGWRSALIVASALPLTVAAVLAQLNWLGVPLHQTSVTGLIIALGLLIDNAIVVVEEFRLERREGLPPEQAVVATVRKLAVPLAASTVTTVLAFLPIVLMSGAPGEFVGPISIGVILSVVTSFVLSMTLIVAFAGVFDREPDLAGGRERWWQQGYRHEELLRAYRRSIHICLTRPWVGVAVSLVLPVFGFAVAGTLSEQFFPANDRNQFQVQLVLPAQASLAETTANALRAREIIHAHPEVTESHWFVGESAPRVFYTMFNVEEGVSSYAGAYVTTRSPDATEALLAPLQTELIEAFPNARVVALPFEQGPPFEAPIEVRLRGPDLEALRSLGDEVRAVLAQSAGITFTTAKLAGGEPKLVIDADEDQAGLVGIQLGDIADQLNARLEGAVGGSVLEANQELPVRVRVAGSERESMSRIVAGRVLAPVRPGDTARADVPGVPLAAFTEVRLVPELSGITRRDGERINTVQAFLEPYTLISDSLADFQRRLDASGFALPQGYHMEFGGEDESRDDALGKLAAFALPLFVVMVGSIVLTFNSFRMAGVIFVVAFLSVGLALMGVWLFGYPMGFVAIVGTMGLVGLAINGAIVVLTALRTDRRSADADVDQTAEVVIDATRHILATTLTTIAGFTPLILFGGRFWPPMATAIAGGVCGAAILALYMVPSLFIAMRRRDVALARRAEVAGPPQPLRVVGDTLRRVSNAVPYLGSPGR
jgi:multidrug efflux pump subunit AcrB